MSLDIALNVLSELCFVVQELIGSLNKQTGLEVGFVFSLVLFASLGSTVRLKTVFDLNLDAVTAALFELYSVFQAVTAHLMHLHEKTALTADFVALFELPPSLKLTERLSSDLELSLVVAFAVLFGFVFQETVRLNAQTEQLAELVALFVTVVDLSLDVVIVVLFESYFAYRGTTGDLGEWLAFVVVPELFVWQELGGRLETES